METSAGNTKKYIDFDVKKRGRRWCLTCGARARSVGAREAVCTGHRRSADASRVDDTKCGMRATIQQGRVVRSSADQTRQHVKRGKEEKSRWIEGAGGGVDVAVWSDAGKALLILAQLQQGSLEVQQVVSRQVGDDTPTG